MDGGPVLQQRRLAYLAKKGHQGMYQCSEAVNTLTGLELLKLTELDTQVSYFLLAEDLHLHCKKVPVQGFRPERGVLIILSHLAQSKESPRDLQKLDFSLRLPFTISAD